MLPFAKTHESFRGFILSWHAFCESKIEHLRVATLGYEDVSGLYVAMHDPFGVGSIECVCHFDGQGKKKVGSQGTPRNAMFERHPVEKLHGDESLAILADVVDRADVGMVERGRGVGFASKAGERLRVHFHLFGQELEGDKTMQARVFGFVDDAHSAAAQFLDDVVVRDDTPDHVSSPSLKHPQPEERWGFNGIA